MQTPWQKRRRKNYCKQSVDNPDIIGLTEIFPKNSHFDNEIAFFEITGYDLIISDLENGRGIALLIKEELKATEIKFETEFRESTWCEIKLQDNDKLAVGCIYIEVQVEQWTM